MGETRTQVMSAVLNQINNMTFNSPINNQTTWANKNINQLKLLLFSDVAALQPAVFLVTHREIDQYTGLGLIRRRLELLAWCYSRSDNSTGQTDLDTMMEAFDTAFGANAVDNYSTNQLTFNGLVYWCRIEGRVIKDPGDIDNQTLLIVPIIIEMP